GCNPTSSKFIHTWLRFGEIMRGSLSVEQSWIPVVSGFLLSRVIRKDRDEPFVYNSGGSSFASRPVWRNTSGDYSWRSGSGKKESYSSGGFTTKKASTVSRGGYGRSSSARGHWGG
ncbi:DUF1190 domain-containing protein, partial [Escherichia coli]|uniref:DUF1190 domain-containing protein n=1 Tax=Escherichia coli TaxID=562 RepID=UPI001E466EF7